MVRLYRWIANLFRRRPPHRLPGQPWSDLDAKMIALHMQNAGRPSALR
jgi:hypothetical protein